MKRHRAVLFGLTSTLSATALGQNVPPNPDVPRATYILTMDEEFKRMDADKSGQATRLEIEAFQRNVATAQIQARNRALFQTLDSDKNGQLTPAEFAKMAAAPARINVQPLLAQFDTDRNGQISIIEYRAGKLAYYDKIDTDKNGIVTLSEMRAAGVIK